MLKEFTIEVIREGKPERLTMSYDSTEKEWRNVRFLYDKGRMIRDMSVEEIKAYIDNAPHFPLKFIDDALRSASTIAMHGIDQIYSDIETNVYNIHAYEYTETMCGMLLYWKKEETDTILDAPHEDISIRLLRMPAIYNAFHTTFHEFL